MLQLADFLSKIGADTAENEQHFVEILLIGRRVADRCDVLPCPYSPGKLGAREEG